MGVIIWMSNLHCYEGKLKAFSLLLPMLATSMWAPLVKTKTTQHSKADHVYVACCGLLQPHALIWADNC